MFLLLYFCICKWGWHTTFMAMLSMCIISNVTVFCVTQFLPNVIHYLPSKRPYYFILICLMFCSSNWLCGFVCCWKWQCLFYCFKNNLYIFDKRIYFALLYWIAFIYILLCVCTNIWPTNRNWFGVSIAYLEWSSASVVVTLWLSWWEKTHTNNKPPHILNNTRSSCRKE